MAVYPAAEPRSFEHHVLDFLAYLEFERGLSRNTLEAYRSDLLQFGAFLGRRGTDVLAAEHADLAAFLSELAAGGPERPPVAAATLQRKAACLRSFYRHLRREGELDRDPTADLRAPRKSQKLPRALSRDEGATLLSAPRGTDPGALRDRALLELMYACGLRASEAIGLEGGDGDPAAGGPRGGGKGPRSASSRSVARRCSPRGPTSIAGGPRSSGCATSRASSSTGAAAGSRGRGSARSSSAAPATSVSRGG